MRQFQLTGALEDSMLNFRKPVSGASYAMNSLIRIACLAGVTIGFPYFVYFVIQVAGARNTSGASGALALVLGMYLKPLIYLIFCLSFLRLTARRAATLGMSAWYGLTFVIVLLGDIGFATVFGSHWSVAFTMGVLRLPMPWLLLAGLCAVLTLCLLPRDAAGISAGQRFGWVYRLWAALLLALAASAIFQLSLSFILLKMPRGTVSIQTLIALISLPKYLSIALAIVSLWLVIAKAMKGKGGTSRPIAAVPPPGGALAA